MKLKENGVLFIILPSGYIGNKNKTYTELRKFILQYKVLGIFELPKNTFKRSGTGVNTALLIIQKTECKCPYEIFISSIEYRLRFIEEKHPSKL
jgi:type I restriction-modification system DNA methylase subunit